MHGRWLGARAREAVPFALLVAGGLSAIGVAFGAWALGAAAILLVLAVRDVRARRMRLRALLGSAAVGIAVLLICAWPTWSGVSESFRAAQSIAATANPGNLHRPLRPEQALGTWFGDSYLVEPSHAALYLTWASLRSARAGGARRRAPLPAGAGGAGVDRADARGVAGGDLVGHHLGGREDARAELAGGADRGLGGHRRGLELAPRARRRDGARDGGARGRPDLGRAQYHASNLAPTGRYEELASLNARYAGRGPTLFTDYDEYALYDLRSLDVGGPNFIYPPTALARVVPRNGYPVDLDGVPPARSPPTR